MDFAQYIDSLRHSGNFRSIPTLDSDPNLLDLSTNDYLGLAADDELLADFRREPAHMRLPMTSSASRLLASAQREYALLERQLSDLYGRQALLFNSGYHANTGLVSALADPKDTVILADKLVHASIIDGIKLSGAPFERFRHNDVAHLVRLAAKHAGKRLLVIVESIYSMDGDSAPLQQLVDLKRQMPDIMLYVDEAHAVGAVGPGGLGLCAAHAVVNSVDVLVGTFGKALASQGAFAILADGLRDVVVNRARSLIFSTAIPPIAAAWTRHVVDFATGAESLRERLADLSQRLWSALSLQGAPSHIIPIIVGDATKVVEMSQRLRNDYAIKILPIRTPTVPPGTERLRVSLSANLTYADIDRVAEAIRNVMAMPGNNINNVEGASR